VIFNGLHRETVHDRPPSSAVMMDVAAQVQVLKPGGACTLQQYASAVFIPKLLEYVRLADRLDLIWEAC
jgi:hypothetical protein